MSRLNPVSRTPRASRTRLTLAVRVAGERVARERHSAPQYSPHKSGSEGKKVVYEKRIFIIVLALLVCFATAVWAGGQDDEAAAGKAELDFDTWMYNYEPWNGMIQTVVDKYMELNPNVIIKVRGGDWSETKQTLLSMAAAGDALDIMNLDTDWHVGIAAAGVLTDLREVAAPEQLADMNVESGVIEGTLFAVPTPLTHSGTYSNHRAHGYLWSLSTGDLG